MIPPWLTLSNIRYVSRVKWSNLEKGVASSPTPRCSSYWKGSLLVALNYSRQLDLMIFKISLSFSKILQGFESILWLSLQLLQFRLLVQVFLCGMVHVHHILHILVFLSKFLSNVYISGNCGTFWDLECTFPLLQAGIQFLFLVGVLGC